MIRLNIGTIVATETLAVRLKGRHGAPLGEVEETGHTQADGSFSLRLDVTGRHVVSVIDPATSASSARHVVVLGAVDPLTVDLVRRPSDPAPTVDA